MNGSNKDGAFTTNLKLPKGTHEYKFVKEDATWFTAPLNMHNAAFYKNSVV